MIEFSWRYVTYPKSGNTFIEWEATWDGEWENDPLYWEGSHKIHPFRETGSYKQQEWLYDYWQKKAPALQETLEFFVEEDDGSLTKEEFHVEYTSKELADMDPEKIRTISEIVAVNPVTLALCEMLSDQAAIADQCGNVTCPVHYRDHLIEILDSLWD